MCFRGLKASLLSSLCGLTLGSCPSSDPSVFMRKTTGGLYPFLLYSQLVSYLHSSSSNCYFLLLLIFLPLPFSFSAPVCLHRFSSFLYC